MNYKLTYIVLILGLISCKSYEDYFKPETLRFDKVKFDNDSKYLMIHSDFQTDFKIIDDQKAIKDYLSDFSVFVDRECKGTTPDFQFELYKNQERVDAIRYCGWNKSRLQYGGLKKYFIQTDYKDLTPVDLQDYIKNIDSLKSIKNVFFLTDTAIPKYNGYFSIYNIIDSTDLSYEKAQQYEKELEQIIKNTFTNIDYDVIGNANSFSPDGITKLNMKIYCDSGNYRKFNLSKLFTIDNFENCKQTDFIKNKYKVRFITW